MRRKETIAGILDMIAEYNRRQYEYGKEHRKYGTDHLLRHDQVHLIHYIGHNPGCNLRYLANTIGLGLPTISLQVKKLETMGLILKRRSSIAPRELELNLSDAGWTVFRHHEELDSRFVTLTTNMMEMRYSDGEVDLIRDFVAHILIKQDNQI